ncbi:MAG: GntR family transcriptional regulator [Thermomicrobiales bacterium]|nr:GntR family transcriptional regulator [Thermomicrobiales bacterium]
MTRKFGSVHLAHMPPVPLYHRVKAAIQKDIREGHLRPGDMLPSEKALCAQFQVSSITVRRALRDLVESGLIYRENGVGTFVAQRARRYAIALIFCGFAEDGWRRQSHMFGALIGSVGQVIWEHGSALTVSNLASPSVLTDAIREIGNNRTFDGLLIRSDQELPGEVADVLNALDLPYVMVKKKVSDRPANVVWMDNRHHARIATEHLLALGHRRIGLIFGRANSRTFCDRALGYRDAFVAAGLPVDESLIRHGADEFAEAGYAETMALLDDSAQPTAIIIGGDHLGFGVLQALGDRGVDIPAEMSLVGFDEAGFAARFQPQLTTLATTDFDLGQESARLLLALLNGEATAPTEREIVPRIVARGTSLPPRSQALT